MALLKSSIFCKSSIQSAINSCRNIQTTAVRAIDMKWREDRRLHRNPNAHGPLTDLPDYSFMDGSLTPLGSHQKKRIAVQRQLTKRMVTLINEVDEGKLIHQRALDAKQKTKEDIISNKLKPKGYLLLKTK